MVIVALRTFLVDRQRHPDDIVEIEEHIYIHDLVYFLQQSLQIISALEIELESICVVEEEGTPPTFDMKRFGRQKWVAKEKDISSILQSLESQKTSFSTIVTLLTRYLCSH